ncbi:molybdate ABC transporter substrate-binding protein [Thalassotalea insulae]|uniref:Molybdate ABC transporter substrate-binding protein n=1 Tax=Thalassotalea insulae TaxID=2056778 RepID=A0ABQ6GSR8_9GAMM|nr:molybdate ABC transporter substrate-binding protein [Thalassotalea insulae]GLX77687.1 molybdate ABC transporter substrate-binding protein [Thalassotalea insulae]
MLTTSKPVRLWFLVVTLWLTFSVSASQDKQVLRIAVAANFVAPLNSLLPEFTEQTGISTQVFTGSTGNLFQQIAHGAPYDIFLAADTTRPQKLISLGKANANSLKTYAIGELAFWSSQWQQESKPSLDKLVTQLRQNQQKFAIANPKLAPYGKAAKQALVKLQLWPELKKQLVTGTNINQTFQQLRSGAVTTGIVALSQLKQNKYSGIKIPVNHYQPIKQQLVIITASQQIAKAQKFSDFLLAPSNQEKLNQLGYHSASAITNN